MYAKRKYKWNCPGYAQITNLRSSLVPKIKATRNEECQDNCHSCSADMLTKRTITVMVRSNEGGGGLISFSWSKPSPYFWCSSKLEICVRSVWGPLLHPWYIIFKHSYSQNCNEISRWLSDNLKPEQKKNTGWTTMGSTTDSNILKQIVKGAVIH